MKKIISIFILCLILVSLSGCTSLYFKKTNVSGKDEIYEKLKIKADENNKAIKYRNNVFGLEIMVPKDFYPKERQVSSNNIYLDDIYFGDTNNNNYFEIYVMIPENLDYNLNKHINSFGVERKISDEKYIGTNVKITDDNFIYFIKNGYIFRLSGSNGYNNKTKDEVKLFFSTLKFDENVDNLESIKTSETDLFMYKDPIGLNYRKEEISADVLKNKTFYYSKNIEKKLNSNNKIIGYEFYIKNLYNNVNKYDFNVYAFPRNIFNYKSKIDFIKDFKCMPKFEGDDNCAWIISPKNIQFTKDYILFPFVNLNNSNIRHSYEIIIEDTLKAK